MEGQTYADAGVSRDAADELVVRLKKLMKGMGGREGKSSIGGYASLYALDSKRWLAATTDGVGTKLKLAFQTGIHGSVGVDLVAMSVNDLLCAGAEPLFFLDYFATGQLKPALAAEVIEGIARGCEQAQMALVGGETAEMPGFYSPGEYDLAGFAVGSLDPQKVLPKPTLKAGDVLLGLPSSGFHSNGYSLVRKLLEAEPHESRSKLEKEFLTPTRIYVPTMKPLLKSGLLKGAVHITGGGIENLPRILPEKKKGKLSFHLSYPSVSDVPNCFQWVRQKGVPEEELFRTFNMGVGMVLVVGSDQLSEVERQLKRSGEDYWHLGELARASGNSELRVEGGAGQKAWSVPLGN